MDYKRYSAMMTVMLMMLCVAIVRGGLVRRDVRTPVDGMKYLSQFGYLAPQTPETGQLRTHKSVTEAIKQFQRMAGLPATGKIDGKTKEMMSLPRCGVSDRIGNGNTARKKRYTIQGSKWPKSNLSFIITDYTPQLPREEVDRELSRAFKVWSKPTSLRFQQKKTGPADIKILFARGSHNDRHPFDGSGGTLAHAFFPKFGGDAHFDDSERWTIESENGVNLFQVAAHEFGHSLGLAHSDVITSLMAPFYRGYDSDFRLSKDDISAIQEIYGTFNENGDHPQTSPTRGPSVTLRPICRDSTIDAVTRTSDGTTYIFKGTQYYRLSRNGIDLGYPRRISWDWKGVTGPIDAAFTWEKSYTFLFKDDKYWKFKNMQEISRYPRKIRDGFKGVPDNIDAAFVWSGNGKTYFIKGDKYWRWSAYGIDFGYPKALSIWRGLPLRINAAFKWRNKRTYFFSGTKYYRFNDNNFRVDDEYPREISYWWLGCTDQLQKQHVFGVHAVDTSRSAYSINTPQTSPRAPAQHSSATNNGDPRSGGQQEHHLQPNALLGCLMVAILCCRQL